MYDENVGEVERFKFLESILQKDGCFEEISSSKYSIKCG